MQFKMSFNSVHVLCIWPFKKYFRYIAAFLKKYENYEIRKKFSKCVTSFSDYEFGDFPFENRYNIAILRNVFVYVLLLS